MLPPTIMRARLSLHPVMGSVRSQVRSHLIQPWYKYSISTWSPSLNLWRWLCDNNLFKRFIGYFGKHQRTVGGKVLATTWRWYARMPPGHGGCNIRELATEVWPPTTFSIRLISLPMPHSESFYTKLVLRYLRPQRPSRVMVNKTRSQYLKLKGSFI